MARCYFLASFFLRPFTFWLLTDPLRSHTFLVLRTSKPSAAQGRVKAALRLFV